MSRHIAALVLHHSASKTGNVETIRKQHKAQGWQDIGYHGVILPDGTFQAGRRESIDGAGVFGKNEDRLHICLIGNFAKNDPGFSRMPSAAQYDALGEWLVSRSKTYGVTKPSQIVGHKEIALPGHGTLCPGDLPLDKIRAWFGGDRRETLAEALGASSQQLARTVVIGSRRLKGETLTTSHPTAEFLLDAKGKTFVAVSALDPEVPYSYSAGTDTVRIGS